MANPTPKDPLADKLDRFHKFILDGSYKDGLLGIHSIRYMSLALGVSGWFVTKYLQELYPEIWTRLKRLDKGSPQRLDIQNRQRQRVEVAKALAKEARAIATKAAARARQAANASERPVSNAR